MSDTISSRRFARMSDRELLDWRPESFGPARDTNVAHANREYRKRAARAGLSVEGWMRSVKR